MRLLFYLLLIGVVAGCYPKGPKYASELDLAITNYDESFDFDSLSYILVDTIFHDDDEEDISRAYDEEILQRIESNMNNLGFDRIPTPDSPAGLIQAEADVVITVSAWSSTSINYYGGYYPPSWGWGGWGWYYPPGWGFVTTSTYGSILIDMSDPTTYQNEQVGIVWSGLINGMVDNSSPSSIRSRIDTEIDICFTHPPFNN